MGFIETPYRKVTDGVINLTDEPIYLTAEEEEGMMIAQANIEVDDKGKILADRVIAREEGDFPVVEPSDYSLCRRCSKSNCIDFGFINSFLGT